MPAGRCSPSSRASTVALGGIRLISLRVDPGTRPGTVRVQIALQPWRYAIPEVSTVLYDDHGEALRRLSFASGDDAPQRPRHGDDRNHPRSGRRRARVSVAKGLADALD